MLKPSLVVRDEARYCSSCTYTGGSTSTAE